MGDLQIECPLCCRKSFNSKQSLVEHLANVVNELYCPICNSKCSSLQEIIEHLNQSDCHDATNNSIQNIVIYENECNDNENSTHNKSLKRLSDELSTQFITDQTFECQDDTGDVNKMYEFILKPHELKLIKEDGENRYLIVNQDEADLSGVGTIVTKQNNDGTVTITSNIKEEIETLIIPEADLTTSQEMYNCNACKVSFTSVYDHIQNYHNDQEVVLEDTPSEIEPENNQISLDNDSQESEESSSDKQTARRVITDTGDIVEEPMNCKSEEAVIQQDPVVNDKSTVKPELVLDKQGRAFTRRLVVLDKGSGAIKKEVTDNKTDKQDSYHKVVTKQVQTKDGVSITVYQCMLCNVNVNNLNEFENHPCKVLKYPCPCCPAAYETSKSLCAHMKVHKETPDGSCVNRAPVSYECEVCCTVFLTNKSLKLHRRMHDPVKARPIEPPVANKDGSNLSGAVYRCNICSKMIPFDYRKIHENAHKTGDKMNCSICNKKFSSIEYLEMHMNVHNLDKVPVNNQDKSLPYECLYCTRRFARPHEKVKHERIHTGEKPHSCEICGKSFRVSYCLTLHMRTHTGARPYACPHCGKRFKAHSVYNHHLLTHSEVRAYKCPYCPKAFKTSVQLAGHKNSHTKPFSCQQCNRPFASLYAVRIHTETHSRQNNLKFSCTLCGASYARAFALKDHVKQVHKQEVDGEEILNDNNQQDDWMEKENTSDTEEMSTLNKDLQEDMTDLEMNANELIVP